MFFGPQHTSEMRTPRFIQLRSIDEVDQWETRLVPHSTIVEVGGPGPRSRLAIRRVSGDRSRRDYAMPTDLTLQVHASRLMKYCRDTPVDVAILVLACPERGGQHPRDWWACGHLATHQLSQGRHCLVRQPRDSEMFSGNPWPQLLSDDRVKLILYAASCVSCETPAGGHAPPLTQEHAMIFDSCVELVWPFPNIKCTGRHQRSECGFSPRSTGLGTGLRI